jgi:ActR/RegA family two-component response regulator
MVRALPSNGGSKTVFDALVFTDDRDVELRCATAFAALPLDWTIADDLTDACDLLAANRFDFVVVDTDAEGGSTLLATLLTADAETRSAVLAVSSAPVDPVLLRMCYQAQFYYPVRPRDIEDAIFLAVPLAEQLKSPEEALAPAALCPSRPPQAVYEEACTAAPMQPEPTEVDGRIFHDGHVHVGALLVAMSKAGPLAAAGLMRLLRMNHSLSIRAHEWIASLMAAAGTAWYVHEITSQFQDLLSIQPPSPGPTYVTALGLLLWLCAKSRRVAQQSQTRASV